MEAEALEILTAPKNQGVKVLYFEIDGTLLDDEDNPKSALAKSQFEAALKAANFEFLACVSTWVDILAAPNLQFSLEQRKEAVYQKLAPLFSDKAWFMSKIMLLPDTNNRGKYIDLNADWYYVDVCADTFFEKAHGAELYQEHLNNRILLCDHRGDGSDIFGVGG